MKSPLSFTEEVVFTRLMKIRGLTIGVLRRAMYHVKKREHICTQVKCNRQAAPGHNLCPQHANYHTTWQLNRRQKES